MPADSSPGALVPGSTPIEASKSVLKGLLTLQGLALVGAGAWVWTKVRKGRKATKRNPLTRADLHTHSAKLQKAKDDFYAAYQKAWNAGKTKLSFGDWMNTPAGQKAAARIERRNPTASWCRSMRKRRGAWLKRRFNRNPWSELDSGLPRGGAFPEDKKFKDMVAARVKSDLRRERLARIRDRQRRRGSKHGNLWANPRRRNPSPHMTEKLLNQLWKKHYAFTSPVRHKQSTKADRVASRLLLQMPAGRTRNYIARKFETRGFRGQSPEILPVRRTIQTDWGLPKRPALRAYDDGSRWNGWAEPIVTEAQLRKIAKVINNADIFKYGGTAYEKRKDGWYVVQYEEGGKIDKDGTYKLSFHDYRTADGLKKLANIGAGLTWDWKE